MITKLGDDSLQFSCGKPNGPKQFFKMCTYQSPILLNVSSIETQNIYNISFSRSYCNENPCSRNLRIVCGQDPSKDSTQTKYKTEKKDVVCEIICSTHTHILYTIIKGSLVANFQYTNFWVA